MSKGKSDKRKSSASRSRQSARSGASSANQSITSRNAQLMLRVRPDLKHAIIEEAHRRGVSVQTLVLTALRSDGLPVEEQDLEDLRVGRRAGGRRSRTFWGRELDNLRRSSPPQAMALRSVDDEIGESTLEALVRGLARLGIGAGTGGISISNHCGCSCGMPTTANPRDKFISKKKAVKERKR